MRKASLFNCRYCESGKRGLMDNWQNHNQLWALEWIRALTNADNDLMVFSDGTAHSLSLVFRLIAHGLAAEWGLEEIGRASCRERV